MAVTKKRKRAAGSARGRRAAADRKDRLVQTRVPRDLEDALKEEAGKRRLSVSHFIRNVLEDTLDIVDDVVAGVDDIVTDSVEMAQAVQKDAQKLARRAVDAVDSVKDAVDKGARKKGSSEAETCEDAPDPLAHVDAWNRVTLNRTVQCARCDASMPKGTEGHMGISSEPSAGATWLCDSCLRSL